MGRGAGWLAYGVAIAGEASLVISVEDITGKFERSEELTDKKSGKTTLRRVIDLDEVVKRIVATIRVREEAEGKEFGVIVLAEGLAEFICPPSISKAFAPRRARSHRNRQAQPQPVVCRPGGQLIYRSDRRERKFTGLQLGYESRCSRPGAFDVMLGSQLGVGAFRALVEKRLDGVMVSVHGQLELDYVPFTHFVEPEHARDDVRYIEPNSDFHRLARFLETYVND